MQQLQNSKLFLPLGIFVIILSTLLFEVSLLRIFSVLLSSNLAFLAISVTLFGLAFGGILVYSFPKYFSQESLIKNLRLYSLLYPLSLVGFIIFLLTVTVQPDITSLLTSAIIFTVTTIPFILANVVLTLIFKYKSEQINKLYFFDLVGAGLGVILAVILLSTTNGLNVVIAAGIIAFLAAIIFNNGNAKLQITSIIFFVVLLGTAGYNHTSEFIQIKSLHTKIQDHQEKVFFNSWNSFSHISVKTDETEIVESLPRNVKDEVPPHWGIRIDGDAYTPIYEFNGDLETMKFLEKDLSILGFKLATPGQALVIGPGGGRDVLMALLSDHQVTGAEINPIIVDEVMRGAAVEFTGGLYNRSDVNIVKSEGRSFIHQSQDEYDVISIPLVDTWASTVSGNLSLVENNLYTVEAFEDFLSHLTPNGILTISRWSYDGMRILSLYFEAAKSLGITEVEKNIAIVRIHGLDNYILKTTPFNEEQIKQIKNFASAEEISIDYIPDEKTDNKFYQYITSTNKNDFIKNFPKDIKPVTDNQPFFFFTTPTLNILKYERYFKLDGGLMFTFLIVLFFTSMFILLPLAIKLGFDFKNLNKELINSLLYIGYFASLGLAFILIEVTLIQKFILYLEQPIYSYSVVLAAMLILAGIGSFVSQKIDVTKKKNFGLIVSAIGILTLLGIYIFDIIVKQTIGAPIVQKILIASLAIAPISMFMGMLMPLGLRRLNTLGQSSLIPWAWSANGAASVLASVLAIMIAIAYGFNVVLIIGGAIYALGLIFIYATK